MDWVKYNNTSTGIVSTLRAGLYLITIFLNLSDKEAEHYNFVLKSVWIGFKTSTKCILY